MKSKLLVLTLICGGLVTQSSVLAATVPAGTSLVVRTAHVISSHEKPGRSFDGILDQDVVVNGTVLFPAGTRVSGLIETSRGSRSTTSSEPFTLDLTGVSSNGRMVPIKTTGGFQPEVQAKTTPQSRGGFSVGERIFPAGTRLEFRLAQPLQFNL